MGKKGNLLRKVTAVWNKQDTRTSIETVFVCPLAHTLAMLGFSSSLKRVAKGFYVTSQN